MFYADSPAGTVPGFATSVSPITDPARLLSPTSISNPWMPGTTIYSMPAPRGLEIEMAMAPGQTTPRGWGTPNIIPDEAYVRNQLAVQGQRALLEDLRNLEKIAPCAGLRYNSLREVDGTGFTEDMRWRARGLRGCDPSNPTFYAAILKGVSRFWPVVRGDVAG